LHYNWHRHYDPSLGRYTQPDPLVFVDGPSVYGYAGGSPLRNVDPTGEYWQLPLIYCSRYPRACRAILDCLKNPKRCKKWYCESTHRIYKVVCNVKACNFKDTCEQAKLKLAGNITCYASRLAYTLCRYKGGGDDGHDIQLTEKLTVITNCMKMVDQKCKQCTK